MLHRLRVPILPGVIAVLIGIAAAMFGSSLIGPPSDVAATALSQFAVYFVAGAIMGIGWPRPSWAWGVWVAMPLVLLILLSVAFAGQFGAFLRHDLVPLIAVLGGGLAGGGVGAFARATFSRSDDGPTGA